MKTSVKRSSGWTYVVEMASSIKINSTFVQDKVEFAACKILAPHATTS